MDDPADLRSRPIRPRYRCASRLTGAGPGWATCARGPVTAEIDLVDTIVLTTGDRAYRRRDGMAVVPLALLGC